MNDYSMVGSGLSGKKAPEPKKPAKVVEHMHIKKVHGGYHVRHEHTSPMHPPEEHMVPNTDALHEHVEQHMGEPNPGEAQADAGSESGNKMLSQAVGLPGAGQ